MTLFKVSLFDDRTPETRTETGLHTNNGMVFITHDRQTATDKFKEEVEWFRQNAKEYNMRQNRDKPGISVNLSSSYKTKEDGSLSWSWIHQSHADYFV